MKTRRKRPLLSKGQQYALGFFILLSVLTFSLHYALDVARQPFVAAKEKAVQVATDYAELTNIEEVAIYHGSATYYSVIGENPAKEKVVALIPEASSAIMVYPLTAGISQSEAQAVAQEQGAGQIDRALLGYEENQPIWEVKSGSRYYIIAFETGELLKEEGL